MRNLLILLSFVLFSKLAFSSEKYTIIKVIGTILIQKTGNPLISGDIILPSDAIVFKSPESKASVISSEKGRMVLSADGVVDKQVMVKSSLIPPMSNIASRNGPILSISDVQGYFSGDFLLLNQGSVKISKNIFPMNDTCFFYINYSFNGEEINKKLPFDNEMLLLDRNNIFKVDGKSIEHQSRTKVKIGYFSGSQSLTINEMFLIAPEMEALSKEIEIIIKQNEKKSSTELLDDIVAYATEFYGKADREQMKNWLEQKFGIRF